MNRRSFDLLRLQLGVGVTVTTKSGDRFVGCVSSIFGTVLEVRDDAYPHRVRETFSIEIESIESVRRSER